MVEHEPSVERSEVHLDGPHTVYYKEGDHETAKIVGNEKSAKFIASLSANQKFKEANNIR